MSQILSYTLYLFVILYAVLTIIAAFADIIGQGFQYWHSFYFIGAVGLLLALIPNLPHWGLPVALILLIIIAIVNGLLTNSLQINHIVVRSIISLIVGLCWMYLNK